MSNVNSHPHGGSTQGGLKKTLGTWQLWGIAVGLVISGEYFGWSYGWAKAGTLGFLVTSAFVAAMYTTFIFSFTELTTSIPHAGGPFAYAKRAFGQWADTSPAWRHWSSSCSRHPPFRWPSARISISSFGLSPTTAAVGAYLIFMSLNIVGVQIAAAFELTITLLAVFELLVFMGVVAGFHWSNFTQGGWAGADSFSMGTFGGILGAVPFAIWFFLAIEGVAMAAEEARIPGVRFRSRTSRAS